MLLAASMIKDMIPLQSV